MCVPPGSKLFALLMGPSIDVAVAIAADSPVRVRDPLHCLLHLALLATIACLASPRQEQYHRESMDMDKDDRVQLNVRVRPGARKALKALAALRGQGQSEVLEEMIEKALQTALVEAADEIKRQGRRVIP
jgi:hypothetical protein